MSHNYLHDQQHRRRRAGHQAGPGARPPRRALSAELTLGSIARTIGYADTSAPPAPTLTVTAQGTDTLVASWTAVTDTGSGLRYYRLYVGTTAGTLALTETFSRATTAWLITGLPAQSTRYARVDAVDGAGNVSSSAVVSGTTQASGSGGALDFAQPSPVTYAAGQTVSLALSQYVTGGGATKLYHRISGSLPGDLSLATATGTITGTARQVGSFSPTIRVADATADALEADWVARKSATGVKWAHDFRADTEVTNFAVGGPEYREDGTTPRTTRVTTDYITGTGCLELYTPAGTQNSMGWARPFAAFPGDVGYSSGAALPSNYVTNWYQFRRGLYGHPDYQTNSAAAGLVLPGGARDGLSWDGHDFYVQFRAKISASCWSASQTSGLAGKFIFIDLCGGGNQHVLVQSPADNGDTRRLRLYTNYNNRSNSKLDAAQGQSTATDQPGGDCSAACTYPTFLNCWDWPTDEWVTVLIHVVPGHHNGTATQPDMSSTSNRADTGIEIWVARYGASTYTKVWEKMDYVWSFDAESPAYGNPYGFNVFTPSQYMNNTNSAVAWYRRITQVIFSTRFIECPKVYA